MHTIFIGYSPFFSGNEMIAYFDIDPNHKDNISKFEQNFGSEYIDPGNFEVYDPDDYKEFNFDSTLIGDLLPFSLQEEFMEKIDFNTAKCVFYVKTSHLDRLENDAIRLFGPVFIEKFDYE